MPTSSVARASTLTVEASVLDITKPIAADGIASSRRMQRKCRKHFAIIQLSATEAVVSALDTECSHIITVTSEIRGVDIWKPYVLVWTSADADLYEFIAEGMNHLASFTIAEGSFLLVHQKCIFQICDSGLKILSLKGTDIRTLFSNLPDDKARCMDVSEECLVMTTTKMVVHMWNISGSEIKTCGTRSSRRVMVDSEGAGDVNFLCCNCDCSKLGFLTDPALDVDCSFFVYDIILDKLLHYSFRNADWKPCSLGWDGEEPKLIACETCFFATSGISDLKPVREITTFFVDSGNGIYKQHKVNEEATSLGFLGMYVPYTYFVQEPRIGSTTAFQKHTLSDFVGMETVDVKTRAALLEYSYNVAVGNVYAAYNVLSSMQDPDIWEKIVRTCVHSKRLDVAMYCFGKMKCVSAAAFINLHRDEPEEEARLAALAIQLCLKDEATKLYIECGRYDLLNQMYQMCGDWEKALEVAFKHDRVHLKNTHHSYAKHLETLGRTAAAIRQYELSETHRYEVPRMLYSVQQIDELQDYVDRNSDPVLQKWWAHVCEANNELPNAIAYYKAAGDIISLVRVYCLQNDFSSASDAVKEATNPSAAFYLARQYEKMGNVPSAIQFFTKAGKYDYAAQLAMKYGVDSELLSLSLQSPKELMLASAQYFEAKGMYEESVLLYQKGGDIEKAIVVCFRSQLFDALKAIAEDLKEGTDPALLARCGNFLLEHKQTEKAVQLFIAAKQYDRALDLCIKEGVIVTEKMADLITPNKEGRKTEDFVRILLRVADCCKVQGSYHLACKKYAQAGDRVKAMQALLKSGDTERIKFFANVSRQKQLYVLAANYLQSLDSRQDASIMKTIVQMYTKAGEMQLLASYYESCAQIEIDEFRDYGKALSAMKEALRCLVASNVANRDEAVKSLQRRTSEVERFVQVRRMAKSNPAGMVRGCGELLQQLSKPCSPTEAAVRVGDLYALLIELYHSQGNMEQAFDMIDKMKSRRISLGPYVDPLIVEAIYQANGLEVKEEDLDQDEIDEDIVCG